MKRNKTFYDWCIEEGHQDILDCWDCEKNEDNPQDIPKYGNDEKRYFKCPVCGHSYPRPIKHIVEFGRLPKCPYCESFGVWCEKHERRDFLKRWDYEKNKVSPYDVSKASAKKYYFKCPRGLHPSEAKSLANVTTNYKWGQCVQCKSFGQWALDTFGDDFFEKYWSSKNTEDPMKLWRGSKTKVWFKCQEKDYHQDYEMSCAEFSKGERCPYCAMKKIDPRDSLGGKYPESIEFWFQKNPTPFQVSPTTKKMVYWKCEKHGLFRRSIFNMVKSEFTCPKCQAEQKESRGERKVRVYLEKLFGKDDVRHEEHCTISPINPETGMKLKYDNEVVSIKLIIQVNGEQHYRAKSFYYNNDNPRATLEYRQKLDKYKKEYAIEHGYNFLEIPYNQFDKKNTWKKSIDDKIASIKANAIK